MVEKLCSHVFMAWGKILRLPEMKQTVFWAQNVAQKESRQGDCPPPRDGGGGWVSCSNPGVSVYLQFSTWHSLFFWQHLLNHNSTSNWTLETKWLPETKATSVCDDRQILCPIAQGHKCRRHLGQLLPDAPAIPDAPTMMQAPSNHSMSQPLWIWSIIADTWLPCFCELAAVRFGMWNILSEGYAGLGWK